MSIMDDFDRVYFKEVNRYGYTETRMYTSNRHIAEIEKLIVIAQKAQENKARWRKPIVWTLMAMGHTGLADFLLLPAQRRSEIVLEALERVK